MQFSRESHIHVAITKIKHLELPDDQLKANTLRGADPEGGFHERKTNDRCTRGDFCMCVTYNNGFFPVINDVQFLCFFFTKYTWKYTPIGVHTHFICTRFICLVPQLRVLPPFALPVVLPTRTRSKRFVMRGGSK